MTNARLPLEQKQEKLVEEKKDTVAHPSNAPASSLGIFSLKMLTLKTLLAQEHTLGKEAIRRQLPAQLHDEYTQFKQKNLKHLLEATISGKAPDEVKKIMEEYPILLLEKLDKNDSVTAPSGQKTTDKTPYQAALWVEDTQMSEMIKGQLIKVADEKEEAAQYNEQLPKEWEKEEQIRWKPIFDQLDTLTQAIRYAEPADIKSSGDPEYKLTVRADSKVGEELAKFHSLLDGMLNEIATTGRQFNPNVLQKAWQIYDDHYHDYFGNAWDNPRAMLFWQRTIGYIQCVMPANYVQAFCDGVVNTTEKLQKGIPQGRSFEFEVYDGAARDFLPASFYPLTVSRLGIDFAFYAPRRGAWPWGTAAGRGGAVPPAGRAAAVFSKFMSIKSSKLTELTPHPSHSHGATMSCLVM